MPFAHTAQKGKNAYFELKHLGSSNTKPTAVNVTVNDGAGAAQGVNSITVDPLSADVPANAILITPAGDRLVVTADASAAATTIAVEALIGVEGAGIPAALADDAVLVWSNLYGDSSSTTLDFQKNATEGTIGDVTHGSPTGGQVQQGTIQTISPTINRQGEMPINSQLPQDILNFGDTDDYFWGRETTLNDDGSFRSYREGFGVLRNVSEPKPAGGVMGLSYDFVFRQAAQPVFTDVV